MNKEDKVIPKRLYEFNAGNYCGVFMPEHVMKKLVKLHSKYNDEVRKILNENKDELYASHWTLANKKDGEKIVKQVYVKYTKRGDKRDVENRISLFKVAQPEYQPTIYLVDSYEEANEIAEEVLKEELENY